MAVKTTIRTPMSVKMRAKQFAMFDALKGLKEVIEEKEKQSISPRELSADRIEEINQQLKKLVKGDFIVLVYYCQYGKKYRQISGQVAKIDSYWREIQVEQTVINFTEIYSIIDY